MFEEFIVNLLFCRQTYPALKPDRSPCCLTDSFQIALVNNFLKLGLNELKLRFRERLTKKLYDEYLQ